LQIQHSAGEEAQSLIHNQWRTGSPTFYMPIVRHDVISSLLVQKSLLDKSRGYDIIGKVSRAVAF